jgi:hypothetical protein
MVKIMILCHSEIWPVIDKETETVIIWKHDNLLCEGK